MLSLPTTTAMVASQTLTLLSTTPTNLVPTSNTHTSLTTTHRPVHRCKAAKSSSSSPSIAEFDLYELLGIESSSDQTAIKAAYRSLQKRCHPDVAGPGGHDMAIILNEAYALLSDPVSRFAYDKEQVKTTELRGYTGWPLYSVWMGPETERRAVFVDEIKCVGCLKCALFANKTFAIESVYGRARVVAQWADPEHKIQESIDACPVNCISIVERADLAALEFLMSKQPRGNVRIGASAGGKRNTDVFSEVKVFHKRLEEAIQKKSHIVSKYSRLQRDARISAIQAIKSISNLLYWNVETTCFRKLPTLYPKGAKKYSEHDVGRLRDAASAARRHAMLKAGQNTRLLPRTTSKDEYWIPSPPSSPMETKNVTNARPVLRQKPSFEVEGGRGNKTHLMRETEHIDPLVYGIPMVLAVIAPTIVQLHETGRTVGRLEEHIGGSLALQIVNSSSLQVFLAGATWYAVGVVVTQLVESLTRRGEK